MPSSFRFNNKINWIFAFSHSVYYYSQKPNDLPLKCIDANSGFLDRLNNTTASGLLQIILVYSSEYKTNISYSFFFEKVLAHVISSRIQQFVSNNNPKWARLPHNQRLTYMHSFSSFVMWHHNRVTLD